MTTVHGEIHVFCITQVADIVPFFPEAGHWLGLYRKLNPYRRDYGRLITTYLDTFQV